jgi:hypothetical protein
MALIGPFVVEEADDATRGTPSVMESVNAKEKLRTERIEMMVDAKHRFRALSTVESGATWGLGYVRRRTAPRGTTARAVNRM